MVHYADGKPLGDLTLRTLAMPSDANAAGDIFGGWVMAQNNPSFGSSSRSDRFRLIWSPDCISVLLPTARKVSEAFMQKA